MSRMAWYSLRIDRIFLGLPMALAAFAEAAQRSYRWFLDVRTHEGDARAALRPVTEIGELRRVYDRGATWHQTDLLLLGDID